jgi:hypothetical protein
VQQSTEVYWVQLPPALPASSRTLFWRIQRSASCNLCCIPADFSHRLRPLEEIQLVVIDQLLHCKLSCAMSGVRTVAAFAYARRTRWVGHTCPAL